MDLTDAFDSVPREGLWAVALAEGMLPKQLLQRMYSGTKHPAGWLLLPGVIRHDCLRNDKILQRYCGTSAAAEAGVAEEQLPHGGQPAAKQVLRVQLPGRRRSGKSPLRWWEDAVSADVNSVGQANTWQRIAPHRQVWHKIARELQLVAV